MKRLRLALSLSLLAAIGGALAGEPEVYKAYDGPDVPIEQQVVLKVAQVYPGFHLIEKPEVGVIAYDGKGGLLSGARHADEYRFLPGKHVIAFQVKRGRMDGRTILWFVGVAGKTYSTQLDSSTFHYRLWIQDDATGQPVGGTRGSADEPGQPPPASSDKSSG
ncbi:MAG TPA: hypothetical protein VK753_07340 [Xanthomonadaceae bacterium]|jgi:hypothetical protein|nr:hypothetical protein [Xanthomonadaceae bacterium]